MSTWLIVWFLKKLNIDWRRIGPAEICDSRNKLCNKIFANIQEQLSRKSVLVSPTTELFQFGKRNMFICNPTIVSYNAIAVKIYDATSSLVRFENKTLFLYIGIMKKALA
jgi:hypothetical protein